MFLLKDKKDDNKGFSNVFVYPDGSVYYMGVCAFVECDCDVLKEGCENNNVLEER